MEMLNDWVLVAPNKLEAETTNGLFVPEDKSSLVSYGTVKSSERFKKGAIVAFGANQGIKVKIDNSECLILRCRDLIGIV